VRQCTLTLDVTAAPHPSVEYARRVRWTYVSGLVACAVAFSVATPTASARQSRYCEKPNPNAYLIASPGVSCTTAEVIKHRLISSACFTRTRCVVDGFRCVAYWEGRFDRPFSYTHHALCNDQWRWVVWDGG
jgi:hypothetical protein